MEKEHELEIEVSSAAVREQGKRALAGQPHKYRELIEGFMDNVRILARAVPDDSAVL
jgi:polynucleotide 5'-triphosphatase